MKINLNNTTEFTIENVSKLIASKDDSKDRQLRVTKEGIAFLSDEIGNLNIEGLSFRLETFCAGNDYTGINASQDEKLIKRLYECLQSNWPNPTFSYIDHF